LKVFEVRRKDEACENKFVLISGLEGERKRRDSTREECNCVDYVLDACLDELTLGLSEREVFWGGMCSDREVEEDRRRRRGYWVGGDLSKIGIGAPARLCFRQGPAHATALLLG